MTELRIDLGRLRRNVRVVAERMAPAALMLVVKDDAYGHGVEPVVSAALEEGVGWIGAFDVATGVRAKTVARARARVFAWLTVGHDEVAEALWAGLELGVGDAGYLERVAACAADAGTTAVVHLKIDTGLHRNGVRPEEWPGFVARAARLERDGVLRVAGVWSHISEASDEDDDDARAAFLHAVDAARAAGLTPEVRHLAASAAAWHRGEFRADLVRVGAFCYGIRSADGPDIPGIAPAATLVTHVTRVMGDLVEIGVGSLDGLFSTLAGRIAVGTPAGARALVEVHETASTVDGWTSASVGDEVVVFGPGSSGEASATTLAERVGTVGEEVLLRVSPLVPRVVV
ncbi:alanine racemase [Microbacterium betulae]|uniref:Alanine racemase n=1 Tax=Microbacterium betulae TaxID=2981139 RepID=A0AA97I8C6_9MICO|nr:alanine racemase [Microbacterium sp. AB]WOF24512.1 alanine racemase [Microbacterium sp. AB]